MQTTKMIFSTSILASLLIASGCTNPQMSSEKEEKRTLSDSVEIIQKSDSPLVILPKNSTPAKIKKESLTETPILGKTQLAEQPASGYLRESATLKMGYSLDPKILPLRPPYTSQQESYNSKPENSFISTTNDPLSTFSIDVDTASYSNIRRFIQNGHLPPVGAVRIEEMINYFSYNYPEPQSEPFSISAEIGPCPWQNENRLVRIGIKAKDLNESQLPPSNLVFLVDVSGSMNRENKLPLLKNLC